MGLRYYIPVGQAAKAVFTVLLLAAPVWAEVPVNHEVAEDAPGAVVPKNTPAPNREQLLVDGLKNANLDPRALQLLERAFRDTPRVAPEDFVKTVTQISGQNRELFKPEQVEGLKKLFDKTLAGAEGESGKQLTDAVRKVLKEAGPGGMDPKLAEGKDKEKDAAEGVLDPQVAAMLNAQLAKGLPAQDLAALGGGAGLLAQQGMLGLLKDILGGDKEDKGTPDVKPQPPMPPTTPPGHMGDRGAKDRDKKKDDNKGLLEALAKNRGGGYTPPPPSSSSNDSKKPEDDKKAAPAPASDSASRKKPTEDTDDKKDKKETADTTNSILDGLKDKLPSGPPPKGRPLPPIAEGDFGGGAFGRPGMGGPGGMPGGMGGMGGMGMGGGMGGMGGGTAGASSFSADVFNFGSGGAYPGGGGIAGGSGFNIVREGGYAGANGGGAFAGEEGASGEGDYATPTGNPPRIASVAEQIDMSPQAKNPGLSLVEKMVGFAGAGLCSSEDNAKAVGFCQGVELRKAKHEFSRRIGNTQRES